MSWRFKLIPLFILILNTTAVILLYGVISIRHEEGRNRRGRSIIGEDQRIMIPSVTVTNGSVYLSITRVGLHCSGVLITDSHVATAAHCIPPELTGVTNASVRFYKKNRFKVGLTSLSHTQSNKSIMRWRGIRNVHVPDRYRECEEMPDSQGCREDIRNMDYAIISLSRRSGLSYIPLRADFAQRDTNKQIHILGFPSDMNGMLAYSTCMIQRVSADRSRLYHSCDTNMGNSGGPLIEMQIDSATQKHTYKVIGIVQGSEKTVFSYKGIRIETSNNIATRIGSSVYRDMNIWAGLVSVNNHNDVYRHDNNSDSHNTRIAEGNY